MGLGARSTFVPLVGIVTLTFAQLLPAVAAAQATAPNASPPAPPVHQRRDGEYGRSQPTVYQRPVRRPKALLIAGPIVLGASYAFTALVGLQMLSGNVDTGPGTYCANCDTVGKRFLIPILGPWIALPDADGSDGKALSAVMGIAQATGVVLTIIGISRYAASAPDRTAAAVRSRWQFALVPGKGGGLGMLGGSF